MLTVACGKVRHRLIGHIDLHLCLRIGSDAVKEFLLKLLAHDDGKHEAVEEVVAVDVSKGTGDDDTHAIACNGPCSVFTAGTRTPVLTTYDNLMHTFARCLCILRLVHHEICHRITLCIETKVVHEGIAEELGVAGSAGQVTSRNDEVGIAIVNLDRYAG